MRSSSLPPLTWVIAAAALLAGLVPYALAMALAPEGWEFSGFLINPRDGFSYLAKMRQGADGSWLFRLPYGPEPGSGALIFTFYLALGRLAGWIGANLLTVFHAARLLCGAVMLGAGYFFLKRVGGKRGQVQWGFALFALGSGLGWLFGPLGLLTTDLTVPEGIPFFSLLVNPHFPLATALLAAYALLLLSRNHRPGRDLALAPGIGAALAIVQPFAVLTPLAVGGVWLAWEALARGGKSLRESAAGLRPQLERVAGFGAGAAPWLIYDYVIVKGHPALSVWNAQNQTPSPALWSFLLGFGVVGALAMFAALRQETRESRAGRFMIAWLAVNFLLLYAPFNLQRRLALGLFLPICGLAAAGLRSIAHSWPKGKLIATGVLLLALPSNLLVVSAGLVQVAAGDPSLLYADGERAAYAWIDENLPPNALVLASPTVGNRIPAFADARVLYGHPFETPHAEAQERRVERLYRSGTLEDLRAAGVEFALMSPHERSIGQPEWLADVDLVVRAGRVEILRVP